MLVAAGMPNSVHHLRALLAEALVGRVPHDVAVLQSLDQRAHIIARNRAPGLHRAPRVHEFADQQVLRRPVHHVERQARGERAAADLDGIEMRRQQQHAAPGGLRRLEMLEAGHQRDAPDAFVRRPPADRGLEQRAAEAGEVFAQDRRALRRVQLRQAQLDVAPRDALERRGEQEDEPARARGPVDRAGECGSGSNSRRMPRPSQVGQYFG